MAPSTQSSRALLLAIVVGVATTANAACVPVDALSHNMYGVNQATISADIIALLCAASTAV